MGCGCGGGGAAGPKVNYQVKFKDGSSKIFATPQEARVAIRAGGGGSMKAIQAK